MTISKLFTTLLIVMGALIITIIAQDVKAKSGYELDMTLANTVNVCLTTQVCDWAVIIPKDLLRD